MCDVPSSVIIIIIIIIIIIYFLKNLLLRLQNADHTDAKFVGYRLILKFHIVAALLTVNLTLLSAFMIHIHTKFHMTSYNIRLKAKK
jgi:uncharacterized membrane protein